MLQPSSLRQCPQRSTPPQHTMAPTTCCVCCRRPPRPRWRLLALARAVLQPKFAFKYQQLQVSIQPQRSQSSMHAVPVLVSSTAVPDSTSTAEPYSTSAATLLCCVPYTPPLCVPALLLPPLPQLLKPPLRRPPPRWPLPSMAVITRRVAALLL